LLEEASTSTRTNAWFSLDIIAAAQQKQQQQQGTPALLIVTSPFHQLRSYYTFRRAAQQKGLSIQVCSAGTAGLTVKVLVGPLCKCWELRSRTVLLWQLSRV
jgi:uncharacterized SAM-binding protein YcdF (DUF218 family)